MRLGKDIPDLIRSVRLPNAPAPWRDYGYAPLADGRLGLLRIDQDLAPAIEEPGGVRWNSARLRFSGVDDRGEHDVVVVQPALDFPIFDRFPDGRWLLVGCRARRDEANVALFGGTGKLLARLSAGDAVSHVACLSDDRAWFGYFDEGVFGNEISDGPHPAHSGLAEYDVISGRCRWQFVSSGYAIADCYALGVSGSIVWACAYMDFPIIRIEAEQVRRWKNKVTGARAIAASGNHVILAGGYGEERDRVVLLRLEDEAAKRLDSFRWPRPNIQAIGGRDGVLHAIGEGCWFSIRVEDWVAARARS